MGSVGAKAKVWASPEPSEALVGVGSGVGELDSTVQLDGAVTVKVKEALRSGCSKTAKTRRESGTSNWL